ncbi:Autophagy protein 7, partial [Cladochytrium tenue]
MALVQFEPLSSAVDAGFWHALSEKKVDLFRLDDSPRPIRGHYAFGATAAAVALPPRLSVGTAAFGGDERDVHSSLGFLAPGVLKNTNTIEDFKKLDKAASLKEIGQKIWDAILSGEALDDPSVLASFLLITFADLKKYKYYYWFGFPALLPVDHFKLTAGAPAVRLKELWLDKEVESLRVEYEKWRGATKGPHFPSHAAFFLVKKSSGGVVTLGKLSDWYSFWAGVPESE